MLAQGINSETGVDDTGHAGGNPDEHKCGCFTGDVTGDRRRSRGDGKSRWVTEHKLVCGRVWRHKRTGGPGCTPSPKGTKPLRA